MEYGVVGNTVSSTACLEKSQTSVRVIAVRPGTGRGGRTSAVWVLPSGREEAGGGVFHCFLYIICIVPTCVKQVITSLN